MPPRMPHAPPKSAAPSSDATADDLLALYSWIVGFHDHLAAAVEAAKQALERPADLARFRADRPRREASRVSAAATMKAAGLTPPGRRRPEQEEREMLANLRSIREYDLRLATERLEAFRAELHALAKAPRAAPPWQLWAAYYLPREGPHQRPIAEIVAAFRAAKPGPPPAERRQQDFTVQFGSLDLQVWKTKAARDAVVAIERYLESLATENPPEHRPMGIVEYQAAMLIATVSAATQKDDADTVAARTPNVSERAARLRRLALRKLRHRGKATIRALAVTILETETGIPSGTIIGLLSKK